MKKLVVILIMAAVLLSSATVGWAQQWARPLPAHFPWPMPGWTAPAGGAARAPSAAGPGTLQAQVAKLTAADGAAGDEFGWWLSAEGDTAFVASVLADVGGNADQGAVYVFRNEGWPNLWSQVAKLTADDGAAGDGFGWSVSVGGDIAVIGAAWADVGSRIDQGAAYVLYRNQGGPDAWGQVAKLTAADGAAGDWFGCDVDLRDDTAVVGAWYADVGGNADQGAAYVFYRNQGGPDAWGQVTKLTADDGAAGDGFTLLSLSGDTLAVGALWADVASNADQGAAFIFYRNQGGPDNWGQVAKLTQSDGGPGDWFGSAVSVSGDTTLVSAGLADVGSNADQGAAYIFYRDQGGSDAWGQVAKLTSDDGAAGDAFGLYPSLGGDTATRPLPRP